MKNIIIIPYRNRQKHLDYFLEHSAPLLKNSVDNLQIIIVEQNEGKIFNWGILLNIRFQYDDSIFDNSKYTNVIITGVKLVDKKPQNNNHGLYRTWQINQPFISNNDISKIDLNEVQIKKIVNNQYVLQIYPDIKSAF